MSYTTHYVTVYTYTCPICHTEIYQSQRPPRRCDGCGISGCPKCVNRYHYCTQCFNSFSPESQEKIKKEYWRAIYKKVAAFSIYVAVVIASIIAGVEAPEEIGIPIMATGLTVSFIILVYWMYKTFHLKQKRGTPGGAIRIKKGPLTDAERKKKRLVLIVLIALVAVIIIAVAASMAYYQSLIS